MIYHLHRVVHLPDDIVRNHGVEPVWAMPSARAADASHSSLLRVSTIGGIAIAMFALGYFAVQLLRVFL